MFVGDYWIMTEKTAFLKKIGDNARNRVLEFFIEGRGLDYAKQDVAEETKVSRQTIYKIIEEFIENDFIVFSRKAGKTNLYKLNEKSRIVKSFIDIFEAAIREEINKATNNKTLKPITQHA